MALIFMHRIPTREVFADRSELCGRKRGNMANAEVKAVSTIDTILEVSSDGTSWEKLCKIKSYPKLGGERQQLEVTDMEDDSQAFIPGVQSMETMGFTANYTLDSYKTVKAKAMTDLHYRLKMGENGKDGVATWDGQHDVYANEGAVNGVREMTITCYPTTKIEIGEATA